MPEQPPRAIAARVVLRSEIGHCSLPKLDQDCWNLVESRRTHRNRARQNHRPRRTVPKDLRGRCLNCFSSLHRATSCRRRTRCFRCLEPGHQSYICPRRPGRPKPRHRSTMAWRRVSSTPNQPRSPADQPSSAEQMLSPVAVSVGPHLAPTFELPRRPLRLLVQRLRQARLMGTLVRSASLNARRQLSKLKPSSVVLCSSR